MSSSGHSMFHMGVLLSKMPPLARGGNLRPGGAMTSHGDIVTKEGRFVKNWAALSLSGGNNHKDS